RDGARCPGPARVARRRVAPSTTLGRGGCASAKRARSGVGIHPVLLRLFFGAFGRGGSLREIDLRTRAGERERREEGHAQLEQDEAPALQPEAPEPRELDGAAGDG